jgi:glycosyltransferase involved in cell wall biosynthesis
LLEKRSDDEIAYLYENASALLFLSKGEGFGLPLVEAASRGTRILCSDLPVFHEIAGDAATYVTSDTAEGLAEEIAAWWVRFKDGLVPHSKNMSRLTWEQSAEKLLDVVIDGSWCWPESGVNPKGET